VPVAKQGALAFVIEVDDVLDGSPRIQGQPGVVAMFPVDSDTGTDRQPAVRRVVVDLGAIGALEWAWTRAILSFYTNMSGDSTYGFSI
jgi:hypothetical protein